MKTIRVMPPSCTMSVPQPWAIINGMWAPRAQVYKFYKTEHRYGSASRADYRYYYEKGKYASYHSYRKGKYATWRWIGRCPKGVFSRRVNMRTLFYSSVMDV